MKKQGMFIVVLIIILIVVGLVIFISKGSSSSSPAAPTDASATQNTITPTSTPTQTTTPPASQSDAVQTSQTTTTADGLKITTVAQGTGVGAAVGDLVSVNYTGKLTDGTVFDSNVDPKFGHVQPFQFPLGAGQVIKGWDEGVLGMKVGGKRTLTIPASLGYGPQGQGPIPPNATLIFDVEVTAISHS